MVLDLPHRSGAMWVDLLYLTGQSEFGEGESTRHKLGIESILPGPKPDAISHCFPHIAFFSIVFGFVPPGNFYWDWQPCSTHQFSQYSPGTILARRCSLCIIVSSGSSVCAVTEPGMVGRLSCENQKVWFKQKTIDLSSAPLVSIHVNMSVIFGSEHTGVKPDENTGMGFANQNRLSHRTAARNHMVQKLAY